MPEFKFNVEMVAEITITADTEDQAREYLGNFIDNVDEVKLPDGVVGRVYTVDEDEGPELVDVQ